jgi:ATP-dependent DNA helicase RecG
MSNTPFVDPPQPQSTDGLPLRGATATLIDMDKVAAHIEHARTLGRLAGSADPHEYLLRKKCLVEVEGTLYATRAGILCFGRQPQELMPRAVVDLGHYRGSEQVSFDVVHLEKDIGGTLFEQLTRIETYLWNNTHHGMTVAENSFQRVDVHEYPQIVIRELCANMLAHRDYQYANSACRVMLFRNRIEWASPGGLPPHVTVENILNAQVSRNPVILSVFYEAGYVESFGQGLDTVVAVLKAEDHDPPVFQDTGESFIVGVYGRPLDMFVIDGVYATLSENQRKILTFIRRKEEVTPQDIRALMSNRALRSVQRDTAALVEADLIEAIGGARSVRYRLRS